MACKNSRRNTVSLQNILKGEPERLLFGVNTSVSSATRLQNNLELFDWVARNKLYPNFWGRHIFGSDHLTADEIEYLHSKACKVAIICDPSGAADTKEQGVLFASRTVKRVTELAVPKGTALFLMCEGYEITSEFMRGFVKRVSESGYTAAFIGDTDAASSTFDREFSRCMQTDPDDFEGCMVWATSPTLKEYDRVTTTHFIHPDNWVPYAPSGITRKDISVWQYGKDCHPILSNDNRPTSFDLNLVKYEKVIINKMF